MRTPVSSEENAGGDLSPGLTLNARSIVLGLGWVAFCLVAASTFLQVTAYLTGHHRIFGLVRLFYVSAETNVPTFFSAGLLFFASLLLALITLHKKQIGAPILHWAVLSAGFMYMASDEWWRFHERLIVPGRAFLGNDNLGIFYYAWVVPGLAVVLLVGIFFFKFWWNLPKNTRLTTLVAASLYLGGAIGVELIGGQFAELHGEQNLTYAMITTVEEGLEMAGVIVFIWALLEYIARTFRELRFSVGADVKLLRYQGMREQGTSIASGCGIGQTNHLGIE